MRIYWINGNGFDEYIYPPVTVIHTRGAEFAPGDFDGDGDLDVHISRSHFGEFCSFC
ncbi:MAG: FG-GAP-like repeat-containing protein [Pseudohongiellaceae bacterium]